MNSAPSESPHTSPSAWLLTESAAWLEAGLVAKKRQSVLHQAAIETSSELLEAAALELIQDISSEVVAKKLPQRKPTPAENKLLLYCLYGGRKRIVNRPLAKGERTLSRPLP